MKITRKQAAQLAYDLEQMLGVSVWLNDTPHARGNLMLTVSANDDIPLATITLPLERNEHDSPMVGMRPDILERALYRLLKSGLKEMV